MHFLLLNNCTCYPDISILSGVQASDRRLTEYANRTSPSLAGQDQEFHLVLAVAWRDNGTAVERLLSSIVTGCVIVNIATNVVTFASILAVTALRQSKGHLMMAYMSVFDMMNACWYFCMVTLDYGTHTRLQCFLTLRHSLWFLFGGIGSAAMLVAVSLERLACIGAPVWYWKQTHTFAHKCAGVVLLTTAAFGRYLVSIIASRPGDLVPHCFTSHTFMHGFDQASTLRLILLLASIVIYAGVMLLHRVRGKNQLAKVAAQGNARLRDQAWQRHLKTQRKITGTLGISAAITLVLQIVPLFLWHILRLTYPSLQQLGYLLFGLVNCSSIASTILFSWRHEDIKVAMWSLLTCQKLIKIPWLKAHISQNRSTSTRKMVFRCSRCW